MLLVPLPFVNALLLALVFLQLRQGNSRTATRPFLALIALCCAQSVFLGLRWAYGIDAFRFAIPAVAAALPPVTVECFRGLVDRAAPGPLRLAIAPVAALTALALMFFAPELVDGALILLFLGYALALALLALNGPDELGFARLDGAANAHRASWLAAACLALSAGFDLLVLLDFERSDGAHVAALVSNANLVCLLLIGLAALTAGRTQTDKHRETSPTDPAATAADADIMARLEALMIGQSLYREENLNLARLARKAGLPARQVSRAVNRVTGNNVSRYVNTFRVRDVCRLLGDRQTTVTEAMYRAGFSTKSNFNREFLRITGKTPEAWRKTNPESQ